MARLCHIRFYRREARLDRYDVVVIGAGAAGMMCAVEAAKRGRKVLVLDHAAAAGEKIRISGGGRCNFTNLHTAPDRFASAEPGLLHLGAPPLSPRPRSSPWSSGYGDRLATKRPSAQLFCDGPATQVVELFKAEMARHGAALRLETSVRGVELHAGRFPASTLGRRRDRLHVPGRRHRRQVDPQDGATGFAYELAARMGVGVPSRPGLGLGTPDLAEIGLLERLKPLAGVSPRRPRRRRQGPLRGGDALHPPRPLRPGDLAGLLLLARRWGGRGRHGAGRSDVRDPAPRPRRGRTPGGRHRPGRAISPKRLALADRRDPRRTRHARRRLDKVLNLGGRDGERLAGQAGGFRRAIAPPRSPSAGSTPATSILVTMAAKGGPRAPLHRRGGGRRARAIRN